MSAASAALLLLLGTSTEAPGGLAVAPTLDAEGTVVHLMSVEGAAAGSAVEAANARDIPCVLPSRVEAALVEDGRSRCTIDDAACFARVAQELGAAALLVPVLHPEADRLRLDTLLVDVKTRSVVRRESRLLPPTVEAIPTAVTEQVALTLNGWRSPAPRVPPDERPTSTTAPPDTPTRLADPLGLVRGALLWGGSVGLGAGATLTLLSAGVAAGGYYTFLFGGGVVPAQTRNDLYRAAVGASWLTVAALTAAVAGGGALGAGGLFFIVDEGEEEGPANDDAQTAAAGPPLVVGGPPS